MRWAAPHPDESTSARGDRGLDLAGSRLSPSVPVRSLLPLVLVLGVRVAYAEPVLSVADTSAFEGDRDVHPMVFTVRLSEPATRPVSFHVETLDGTATVADDDYLPVSADLGIPAGDSLALVEVPIVGDSLLEANERFTVQITDVVNAAVGRLEAVGTILNDERTSFAPFETDIPDFGPGTIGPAWGDFNGDNLPDLAMYTNIGGQFVETPGFRAALGDGNYHGGAWCDYDRDGVMELLLLPYGESSDGYDYARLLKNTPAGIVDVGAQAGIDSSGYGETPVWADFDGDGWPDLFTPFYSHVPPYRSFLYLNQHDGTFREDAVDAGVSLPGLPIELRPEGATAADWNGDGTIDLYCASHLFLNDGHARFHDVRAQVGLPEALDEGAQFVDYDNDGDLDLYLRTCNGPTLYRNDGGTFVDVTPSLGIGFVDWAWGDRWCDVDLDGDLDLLFFDPAVGPRLLLANGDGTFTEDSSFAALHLGWSLSAFADIDGDGDPDLVVGDYYKHFARNHLDLVARSRTPYLKVRVEDAQGRLVEQGSTVRLRSLDDPTHPVQTRIVDGGSGYLAQDEYTVTFGGVGSGRFDLEVSFPARAGAPVIVGPAQNPLLGGLRPGDSPPQIIVVRPDSTVDEHLMVFEAGVPGAPGPPAVLEPAAPNPARRSTRLAFTLPSPARASVAIYDVAGRHVRTLLDARRPAGLTSVSWDLTDDAGGRAAPGIYFARFARDGSPAGTRRVLVLR